MSKIFCLKKKKKKNEKKDDIIDIYSLTNNESENYTDSTNSTGSVDSCMEVCRHKKKIIDNKDEKINYEKIRKEQIKNENIIKIIESKKSHIFHSIKILLPMLEKKINEYNKNDFSFNKQEKFENINIKIASLNKEIKKNEKKLLKNFIECTDKKEFNTDDISKQFKAKKKSSIYKEKPDLTNDENQKNKIKNKIFSKYNEGKNYLNNIYKNFIIYENKIKRIEKKKNENDDIEFNNNTMLLFLCNKKENIIKITDSRYISGFYKSILNSINYFNLMNIRNAYYSLENIIINNLGDEKKMKNILKNIFISEILYRYKIIKKIELIFNLNVHNTKSDYINYSVLIKKLYKNSYFDYLIDLKDVNGKLRFVKYLNCLNNHDNSYSFETNTMEIIMNEILKDEHIENSLSNERKNNSNLDKKCTEKIKKNKKEDKIQKKIYNNKYIDFNHFEIAFNDENQQVYFFVTNSDSASKSIIFNSKNTIKKKSQNIKILNKQQKKINIDKIDTTIYYYIDLLIPSNFIYVLALLIEVDLFQYWVPSYNFPLHLGIKNCSIIKERGFFDKIVFAKIAMPLMMSDRYLLLDMWICEDFEFSKGLFLHANNFSKYMEKLYNLEYNKDNCIQVEITLYAFILPKSEDKTYVKIYVEISPNANLNKNFLSFLTKVFIKNSISHFFNVCKEFETNKKYIDQINKHSYLYDKLKEAANKFKIY